VGIAALGICKWGRAAIVITAMDYFEQDESVPRAARQAFKWLQEEVYTLLETIGPAKNIWY
jgi:hypothetical protein